jgi:hypothetical protein
VPDFVDMLSEEPLDDGKPLSDEHLTLVLLVSNTQIYTTHTFQHSNVLVLKIL